MWVSCTKQSGSWGASLEQSIVTYELGPNGPVLGKRQEFPIYEQTTYRPILPIALTKNNLILKGTASGDVPVLDSKLGQVGPIKLGPERIIRTLAVHGDKVIIGSSDVGDAKQGSSIKCYSTADAVIQQHSMRPVPMQFKLSLHDIMVAEERKFTLPSISPALFLNLGKDFLHRLIRSSTLMLLAAVWFLAAMMTVDPPQFGTAERGAAAKPRSEPPSDSKALSIYEPQPETR
ncbi:hypothetical protein CTheo_9091 [Ceratobasidium theobromae]|uniref:Uncharacterized protein n=1 Tax=Ceratobasidium theobromae TaxID=1582974 RepID=A0A5N5Q7Q5_9AGAM|nr:hypothetical protein CTheo_9091 [Ceratobasidium theobromae]